MVLPSKAVVHTFYGVEFTNVPESWDEGSGNEITNLSFMYACRGFFDDGKAIVAAVSDYDEYLYQPRRRCWCKQLPGPATFLNTHK